MNQGNRGMGLETLITTANAAYNSKGIALIDKLPTPIKVTKSNGKRIFDGFFQAKSTVDYYGVYQGRPIIFEAKSTKIESRFELKNIHDHQIQHLRTCESMGAICFVILEFSKRNEIFYVPAQLMIRVWDTAQLGGPKSIPYDDIAVSCYKLTSGRGVVLDYLAVVDELIKQTA